MIANKWYCIAQTGTFDSGCTINVSFDEYYVQCSARVRYGSTAINITRCELPLSISLSLRVRESDGLWSVDLLSNTDLQPEITVADSLYWTAINSVAGAGNVVLTINDISKEFNTEAQGEFITMPQLKAYLDDNGYSFAKDCWKYENIAGGALHTGFNIIVDGDGAFGGDDLGDPTGDEEEGGEGEGGIPTFYVQIGDDVNNKHKLGNTGIYNVVKIPKYPEVPTNVSELYNDAGYVNQEVLNAFNTRFATIEASIKTLGGFWAVDEEGKLHTPYSIVVAGDGAFGGDDSNEEEDTLAAKLAEYEERIAALERELIGLRRNLTS